VAADLIKGDVRDQPESTARRVEADWNKCHIMFIGAERAILNAHKSGGAIPRAG